jgi:hypothetical protein
MNLFDSDIYQNRGFECSATILQVAPKNPLPAAPPLRGSSGRHPSPPHDGLFRFREKKLFTGMGTRTGGTCPHYVPILSLFFSRVSKR